MNLSSTLNRPVPDPADADMADVRRRLLARKLQQQRSRQPAQAAAQPSHGAPLSFAQEGLWFLDLLDGGSAAYNIHSATRLQGPLDVRRLELSLRALVARHPSLRTAFHAEEQGPVQQVLPVAEAQARFRLAPVDASADAGSEAALAARIAASVGRSFELSQAPLLRADLLRISAEHHLLVLVVHHIVADGWSMSIVHRELGLLYARGGDASVLPAPALNFVDHARRQRERFERGEMQAALDHWRAKLQDLQTLQLPTDRPHPARASPAGRTLPFRIDPELSAGLRALAARQEATLFMALLAAFQALLMRYTGQADVAVGVPLAGRDDPRVRDLIGYFANTVVMRGDFEREPCFVEMLQRSRKATLEALDHQEMPFDRLVAELRPQRDASRNPLYQVCFALENFEHRLPELQDLRSERLGVRSESAKFDLSLTVSEAGDHLEAEIEYRTDLFEAQTIERMALHFRRLLAAMVAEPEVAVARLPLMDEAERQRVLIEWNDSARTVAHGDPVHAHFRAQAARTPDAVALRFGGKGMSYAQLDALSEQLAHALRARAVGPEVVVGLCMKRCFGLVVGLLAVFKAGGTLLPLDPDHPPERLRAMLADAAPAVVLAQTPFADALRQLGASPPSEVLEVPADGGEMPREVVPALLDRADPKQLAYLIYTSGSTGTPKAAELTHRGLSNHVLWMNEALQLSVRDRVLQKTSISFDASLWEFLSPLVCGAELVLAPPDVHWDMPRLAATLREEDIGVVQFVPSEMRVILDEPAFAQCAGLRYVLCGGEALDRPLALAFRRTLPGVRLGNFYGPSEAAVDSAWYEVGERLPERPLVPIGRPIANVQLYVLDARLEPQPANVVGELYVGGVGVGRGYRNRPSQTAGSFVPNPFRPGERMYRTGDLARWLNDGVLEFAGRNDHQVKLRGFRIELGEIEAGINGCGGVRMSAVLLREDLPGHQALVAYVIGEAAGAGADALRSELKGRLPDYMIPAAFVFLSELPRLPNGKIDRQKLPRPDLDARALSRVGPRSPVESVLLETWQAVLGRSGFGVRDDFFDLGGHSLLATQIVSRIGATFKVALPLRSMFEHPTIEALAQVVKRLLAAGSAGDSAALSPIATVSRTQPSPVSFSQRRMWVLHEMDPQGAAYNMREALRLRGPLRHAALRPALDALAARHEAFRTTFELADAEPVAIIGAPQPANLVEVDGSGWPEAGRERELEREAARLAAQPFDLSSGPLHRFILVRLGEEDHALVLVMHHIIGDDWSWGILLRELQALYQAGVQGKALPAPARAIDFIDYANWQRQHIGDEILAEQVHYWLQQLAGMSPLNLPVDTAAAQRFTSEGARVRHDFSEDWLRRIQRFSGQHGLSPFMTLLAAFQWLLSRYCGQDDVAVGTPIAGRTRVEAEEVVGSLINTLVLRCVVQPDRSFRALLGQVRETCLAAFTHQDVPLDYLIGRLREEGGGGRIPDVRAMFNVLNTPRQALALEGLDAGYMPLSLGATQFDLALTIDTEGEHALSLTYSTELFSDAIARAMLDNYLHVLDRLVAEPDRPLQDHALASLEERARLAAWNRTGSPYPRHLTVHGLLAERREAGGTALLQMPGASLSYAQLWSRVHRLAHRLRALGVQRGQRVGLCVERDPSMVVAQLAILQAGAAYVPLDPSYPRQRLHDMARHAELSLLLMQRQLAGDWRELALPTLLLDSAEAEAEDRDGGDTAPPPDAERDARPEDPAYIIHTSGSTGRPKGVVVPHRAVVNFLLSMQREPGLCAEDVLAAVTTLSFDIAVLELLLPLSVGATVVLATREQATDGMALRALLEQSGATVMQATPASWQMLIDAGWNGAPGFKALIGGESLSEHMAQALACRSSELWNLYGPTETTVWSTCWKVPVATTMISIGRPIANTQVHVLDAQGHPCPAGVSGEIFIGGDGVARGYLGQPELSAERFVADPFGAAPRARLYKTGDRGRWRHDGLLEHQGRLDFQVKVRGHRIEPGEIEAQLRMHPNVAQCLVMAREDRPGDLRLVAYVVARDGAFDAQRLKDHLRVGLPDYMLPQHYVALEGLPLLPNGKINRHALPAPAVEPRAAGESGRGPRTPAEATLARIWGEVLGMEVDEIYGRDNFFDLGGDSLKAGRAVVLFERACGIRLATQRLIFETLAQLAGGIELRAGVSAAAPAPAVRAEEGKASWLKRMIGRWR